VISYFLQYCQETNALYRTLILSQQLFLKKVLTNTNTLEYSVRHMKDTTPRNQKTPEKLAEVEGLMDLAAAASWLGVQRSTVRSWIKSGALRAHRLTSRCYRIHPDDIQHYLDASATAPNPKEVL